MIIGLTAEAQMVRFHSPSHILSEVEGDAEWKRP